MKKLLVMSDNHGDQRHIRYLKNKYPQMDFYLHCGDSQGNLSDLEGWYAIRGNNDYGYFPSHLILKVEGVNILLIHGHQFGYFDRNVRILDYLKEFNCDICICGHTHVPCFEEIQGFKIINPGSTTLPRGGSYPSYCIITIDDIDVKVDFKKL